MESKEISTTTPWGFQYSFWHVPIAEAQNKIQRLNGKNLVEYEKLMTHGEVYLLDSQEVILTSYVDAIIFESQEAFLANLQTSGMHIRKHISTTPPIQHIRYSLEGQRIVYHQIGQTELKILLNTSSPLIGAEGKVFLTYEGEVLTDYGALFQTKEDYDAVKAADDFNNQQWFSKQIREFELLGRNPYGKDFPAHIGELVEHLPGILNCPIKLLNYKEGSISKLDKYLYQNIITADFADKAFLPLMAYIGEVFVQEMGGQWEMRYDEVFKHWYPDVKNKDGKFKEIFRPLLRILDSFEETYYPLRTVLLSKTAN